MITVLLENTALRDLSIEAVDKLNGDKVVFSGILASGEIETVMVESDQHDYCKVVWSATPHPQHAPRVREAVVGPGDTVEISG